jgi:hypothetical protein
LPPHPAPWRACAPQPRSWQPRGYRPRAAPTYGPTPPVRSVSYSVQSWMTYTTACRVSRWSPVRLVDESDQRTTHPWYPRKTSTSFLDASPRYDACPGPSELPPRRARRRTRPKSPTHSSTRSPTPREPIRNCESTGTDERHFRRGRCRSLEPTGSPPGCPVGTGSVRSTV